jgi:hypothetical protein
MKAKNLNPNPISNHPNPNHNKIQNKYKIYIDGLLPSDLKKHLHKLNDVLNKSKRYDEFITDNGIMISEDNENLYKLIIHDVPIIKKSQFLIDKSIITKEKILSQIPYHHILNKKTVKYYGNSNDIKLVVEGLQDDNATFQPIDFYFLANEYFDFENPINAEELEWFLSVLK